MDADTINKAQEIKEAMELMKEELMRIKVVGESGGGMVKVTMQGPYFVHKVSITDNLLEDKDMLEDMITAAVNDGINKINSAGQSKLAQLQGGMGVPLGMFSA